MRVSEFTLDQFRHAAAGPQPTPAGVAVAAVGAAFALGLLTKVLTVSARRREPAADVAGLEALAAAARKAAQRLLQLAGEDSDAFEAYLTARRMPHATEFEQEARHQAMNSAVGRVIDLPLEAAQEAAAGLQLCSEMSAATPLALAADLGVAASLLAGALRGFLLCADSNVRQLAPEAPAWGERLANATKLHEQTLREAEALLAPMKP